MAASMLQSKSEGTTGTYTYSSQPRAAPQQQQQQQQKYREKPPYGNIMYDRRIIRGNTYALHTLPASSQPDPLELQRQQESRRRAIARRRTHETLRPRSPPPVEGRRHTEVQTELYLEEITDRVEETDIGMQTDAFLDRPPTPLFVPAKIGSDVATQIEEGDLFHFDLEVQPILEVLVGKTVEQALLEVMEEEELASLREQQRVFEENRNAEVVEMQRLEEQERRRREEKERRMQQQRVALLKEKETAEKVAAQAFAQSYLSDLLPSVFSNLNEGGFFYDPVEREVESEFLPWLMDETEKTLDQRMLARALLDSLIRELVMKKLGIEPPKPPSPPPAQLPTLTETPPTPEVTETPPTTTEAPPTSDKSPLATEGATSADAEKESGGDGVKGDVKEGDGSEGGGGEGEGEKEKSREGAEAEEKKTETVEGEGEEGTQPEKASKGEGEGEGGQKEGEGGEEKGEGEGGGGQKEGEGGEEKGEGGGKGEAEGGGGEGEGEGDSKGDAEAEKPAEQPPPEQTDEQN